jgi:hypothetical protein
LITESGPHNCGYLEVDEHDSASESEEETLSEPAKAKTVKRRRLKGDAQGKDLPNEKEDVCKCKKPYSPKE